MKKFSLIALCVLAILTCAYLGAIYYINSGFAAREIAMASEKALGTPIVFEQNPHISLFPPRVTLGRLTWNIHTQGADIDIALKSGSINLEAAPLLSGVINIDTATLDGLTVEINKNAGASQAPATTVGKRQPETSLPELQRLVVQHGTLRYTAQGTSLAFSDINLSAENLRNRQEADINCDFSLATSAGSTPWNMALRTKMRYYAPNLTFRQCAVTCTPAGANPWPWAFPARLAFGGAINFENMQISLVAARIDLPHGRLALANETSFILPAFTGNCNLDIFPVQEGPQGGVSMFSASANVAFAPPNLKITGMSILSAGKPGDGELDITLPQNGARPEIKGNLRLGALRPLDLIPQSQGPSPQPQEGVNPGQLPNVNLSMKLGSLEINKFQVNDLALAIQGRDGAYDIDHLTGVWAGGAIDGSIHVTLPEAAGMLRVSGKNIDLGTALSQFGATELEGGQTDFRAELGVANATNGGIAANLGGSGEFSARNVKIRALEKIFQLLPVLASKSSFPEGIKLMRAEFNATGGVLNFTPLILDARGLQGKGAATVDLTKKWLDGQAQIKVLGLDLPLTFRGPLDNVSFGLGSSIFHRP